MPLSFREKSILISLAVLSLVSLNYFFRVFAALASDGALDAAGLLRLGISLLVVLVVLEVAFKTWIAARSPEEAGERADERDRLIAARAGRNAGLALSIMSIFIVGHVFGNSLLGRDAWISPLLIGNLILLAMVVAQITEYVSQLVYYRRGS